MALDATVGSMPYLLIHGVWFMLFSATYLLWSWINYAANIGNAHGDRFIYDCLNWGDPSGARALGLVIVLMISPIVNFIFWASVNLMNELALQRRSDGPGADTRAIKNKNKNNHAQIHWFWRSKIIGVIMEILGSGALY